MKTERLNNITIRLEVDYKDNSSITYFYDHYKKEFTKLDHTKDYDFRDMWLKEIHYYIDTLNDFIAENVNIIHSLKVYFEGPTTDLLVYEM